MDFTLNKTAKISLGVALAALLGFGVHQGMQSAKKADPYSKMPSYVRPVADVACVPVAQLSNKYTPADLYAATAKCASQDKMKESAGLLVTAMAYLDFDTKRVADKNAHSVENTLKMSVVLQTPQDKRAGIDGEIKKILTSAEGRAALCADLKKLGAPAYVPTYMTEHGKQLASEKGKKAASQSAVVAAAAAGTASDSVADVAASAKPFDANTAWGETLTKFLGCKS